ncbi:hypothetical protein ILUMI_23226 [Ignelater luminosus]|uniref:PiggyBac transposable element-derived protein domain-containing protein n=1 Tax=Ignelater luminosus TaxID=2038154 RepID=A0A8K0CCV6_IGNLU|nr:hypothetical protein ILUMI_23226 [Ignelater luminosus]
MGENITVDEQLLPTKVRCRFTQYMSNKANKFGIKFWIAVDTKSKYVLNAFPYLGKDETRPQDQTLPENVVLRLLEPFTKKGRNGTMNRSRREVPELVKSSRGDVYETVLLKTDNDNCILTVYQAKPNKNVLFLSTLHTSVTINTDEKKKEPETVLYYNDTKYGVDVADQMARKYTGWGATPARDALLRRLVPVVGGRRATAPSSFPKGAPYTHVLAWRLHSFGILRGVRTCPAQDTDALIPDARRRRQSR